MADSTGRTLRSRRELADDDDAPHDPVDANEHSDQDGAQSSAPTSKKRKRPSGDNATRPATPNKYADLLPGRMPGCSVSKQDNRFFTAAWFKEISARDAFWTDWIGKIPKGVIKARFGIHFNTTLDGEDHGQVPLITQQRRARDKLALATARVSAGEERSAQGATEPNNDDPWPAGKDAHELALLDDLDADGQGFDDRRLTLTSESPIAQVSIFSQLHPSRSASLPYFDPRDHLRSVNPTESVFEPEKGAVRGSTVSGSTPELLGLNPASTYGSLIPEPDALSLLKLNISRISQSSAERTTTTPSYTSPKHATQAQASAAEPDKYLKAPTKEPLVETKPSTTLPHGIKHDPPSPPQDIKPKPDPSPPIDPAANSIDCATFIHDGETQFVKREALHEMVSVGGSAFYVVQLAGGPTHVPVGGVKWLTKTEFRQAKMAERERKEARRERKGGMGEREGVVKVEVE